MYITIYSRKPGGRREAYQTKSHTDHHKFLRDSHEGATYTGPKIKVFTHFCEGLPLDSPLIVNGKRVRDE